ncbi:AAA-domain-containing protein [Pleomassaria siparia CBS 279.74]|uniref:AAA-domain-containing protein n=1 Tax=Pleomassaria siparia CBS 279.74 TaxID=1314801 RepID=A0A6G1KIT6_9PLEO|nr:AAA-domain-containing protein [Pleomassaria siparia CBS 279.74]
MTTATAYSLRPLERNTPFNALEGGFRVHLSPKELKNIGVSNGGPIRISSNTGPKGFAVAWNAAPTNAGNKPIAKVTDLLRDKYGLHLEDRVFIENAMDAMKPINSVAVQLVLPADRNKFSSTEEFLYWARYALVDLDMIHPECTLDVHPKGLLYRHKPGKVRVNVQSMEPVPDLYSPLYFDPLTTEITTNEIFVEEEPPPRVENNLLQMSSTGIGGLSEKIETINSSLTFLTSIAPTLPDQHLLGPTAFLIHGPEGTGKTLLLDRLSECAWREVFRLDPDWLTSNSKAQAKAMSETFDKARSSQPSVILMDDLDKFLAKAENLVSRLRSELKKLEGTKVVVAAAARSIYDIDASLRTTSALKCELEMFPPNAKQREDMLRQILGTNRCTRDVNFSALAERTHGFVGRDIYKLCGLARNRRIQHAYSCLDAESKVAFVENLETMDFVAQEDFDVVIDGVQPTVLGDSVLEVPKVRWTDIAGLDHVRQVLEAITIRPFKYPDLDMKFGGPQSRKGVLLYGPPGCAKTLIAQAVATESNQNFLAVKGSELIKMYVGESERAIRDVFRRARAAKPCIIFFDEIDSIGKSREKSGDSGLNVVATLLNEMDGIEALKDVFIIGATNRPDILDSALIRAGRFDAHIHIGLPNEEARTQILQIHTRKKPLAKDVDLKIVASRTEGSSGADIKGLCSVAVEMAISDYEKCPDEHEAEIRMCHFEGALRTHVPHTLKDEAARYEGWRPGKSLSAD